MKKLFLFVLVCFSVSSAFAVLPSKFDTPEKVAVKKASITKWFESREKTPIRKASYEFMLKLLETDVSSFADILKLCEECCKNNNIAFGKGYYWLTFRPVFNYGYPDKFKADAYKFYKANKSYGSCYQALRKCSAKELGFTDAEFVAELESIFDLKEFVKVTDVKFVDSLISKYFDATKAAGTDDAHVKATLKKLNRIFTEKLLTDKAKWEPTVAKIRTMIETY